jgi:ribosomal protein L16 Arg81 hydroxylase
VLHGRKRWFLYPRDDPAPLYDPLTSTYENEWLREAYPTLSPEQKPIECTLSAGELLYFPSMWDHATLNLDNYTSFVSSFQ